MSTEIQKIIESSHLFAGLAPGLIREIASTASKKSFGSHQYLFQKGDTADALWGVLSGRIDIQVSTDDGKEMVLDTFKPGDVFGAVGVLDFGPRRVDAIAVTNSELFRLERKHFLQFLQSSPEFCFRVFSLLCSDLRDTTEALEDSALYTLPGRLARRLVLLAGEETNEDVQGHPLLDVSQNDLARTLGVHRQTVNRQLRDWEKRGWLTLKREHQAPARRGH